LIKKPKTKREKSTSTKGHYVKNADLLPVVLEAKVVGKVTTQLIKMIQMIAERYSRSSNFIGYSFREDMVAAAVMNLCNTALKFNELKYSNAFSYYTSAIHNSFLQYIADEKKHRNIRDALLIDAGSNPSFNYLQGEKDESHFEIKESDEVGSIDIIQAIQDAITGQTTEVQELLEKTYNPNNIIPITPKEDRIRYKGRAPGAVTKYGPEDIEIDPITFAITFKPKIVPEVIPTIIKKPRKPKKIEEAPLMKEQIPVAKSLRTRPAEKRNPTVKEMVKEILKPAKKPKKIAAEPVEKPKKISSKTAEKKVTPEKKSTPKKIVPKEKKKVTKVKGSTK
jgi:hypothetical protein